MSSYPFSSFSQKSREGVWTGAALGTLVPWKEAGYYISGVKIFLSRDLGYIVWPPLFFPSQLQGFWLSTEGLPTCAHQKGSMCLQPSLTKQTLAPARPLCSEKPVTLIRPSRHSASWSLLSWSSFLTNSSLINNCFLTHSRQLYSREGWRLV